MGKRNKTKYPGVYWIDGLSSDGKTEKIFYIKYRLGGKVIEEPVGRQFRDDMTPAKASLIRTRRIEGAELPNREKRQASIKSELTIDAVFLEYQNHSHHKPTTKDREQDRYNLRIKPKFGSKYPEEITQADFNTLIKELKDMGRAPQTIKHVAGLLFRILKFAHENGQCPAPLFKLNIPSINNEKTEDLTPDQVKRLLEAIDADPHPFAGRLMKMALFTGMRAGELYKLEWSDIDYDRGFILIRDPKAGTDKRIPLNEAAKGLLETVPKLKNSPYVSHHLTERREQPSRNRQSGSGMPPGFQKISGRFMGCGMFSPLPLQVQGRLTCIRFKSF